MGIDTVKAGIPVEVQEAAFARQLELAVELDLPVCVHSRDAFPICQRVIQRVCPGGWKGFAHCFSDGVQEALGWKALGFTISFAGQITFKNKSCDPIRDAARALAPEDVVVEREDYRIVRAALDGLSELDQEVLRLSAWEGLTYAEIAVVVGSSLAAVDKRIARAKQRLARRYDAVSQVSNRSSAGNSEIRGEA